MARIVVVGGGVGGLAVAARLARLRHDVTVLERAPIVGGKLQSYRRDGFRFDTGPTLLTLPATLRDLFHKTGRRLEDVLELRALDVLARYRFPDGTTIDVPNTGVSGIAAAFGEVLGDAAAQDWVRFHNHAERVWDAVRTPFVESPLVGRSVLLRLAVRHPRDLVRIAPRRTLRDVARQHLRDPRQQLFVERYATYTGSDPRRAPAVLAVIPYVEHSFRGWYVHGGLGQIATAIRERAESRGVRVWTNAEVRSVAIDGARVSGVHLADGTRIPADVVVSDVDARVLYERLIPQPKLSRRLRRTTPSSSAYVLLLALRGRTPGLRQHTVLFGPDYDLEMDAVFGAAAQPVEDPTLYVSAAPDAAPGGDEAVSILVLAPRHGDGIGCFDWSDSRVASAYADRVLSVLAARGLDLRDRVRFMEWRTPAELERDTGSPGGAIYGTSSNGWRAAFLRPRNQSPVGGLFLVGGSAHPGGGLPMVLMSAAITADLIGRA